MSIYTPADFASDTPPPRIMGTETETMLSIYSDDAAQELTHMVRGRYGGTTRHGFLPNGARVYQDCFNVEYATPECLGPLQTACAEMAGRLIVSETADACKVEYKIYNRTGGYDGKVAVGQEEDKRSHTNGYHQNLLTPRYHQIEDQLHDARIMGSFVSSRAPWAGVGVLNKKGYLYSQKAQEILCGDIGDGPDYLEPALKIGELGSRTTRGFKPVLNWSRYNVSNRMESHSKEWERLEIRHADAPHSPWLKVMSIGAASLTLRILEHKHLFKKTDWQDLMFRGIGAAARLTSQDINFTTQHELISGKSTTALAFQKRLATMALELAEQVLLPEDERSVAEQWLKVCEDIEKTDINDQDTVDILCDRLDWAARLRTIRRHLGGLAVSDLSFANAEAAKIDIIWDQIYPYAFSDKYWQKQQPDFYAQYWTDIEGLMHRPPAETRAFKRGNLVRSQPELAFVDWSRISTYSNRHKTMPDPYNPHQILALR